MLNKFIKSDQLGGLIWFILGMGICLGSVKLKLGTLHNPGPGFILFLSGILLGVLGLVLTFSSFLKELKKEENGKAKEISVKENWKKLSFNILALLGYILLFQPLGFLLSTFLFFFSLLYSFAKPKIWLMPLVISGCAVILSYFVFSICLGVELPRGILKY